MKSAQPWQASHCDPNGDRQSWNLTGNVMLYDELTSGGI